MVYPCYAYHGWERVLAEKKDRRSVAEAGNPEHRALRSSHFIVWNKGRSAPISRPFWGKR